MWYYEPDYFYDFEPYPLHSRMMYPALSFEGGNRKVARRPKIHPHSGNLNPERRYRENHSDLHRIVPQVSPGKSEAKGKNNDDEMIDADSRGRYLQKEEHNFSPPIHRVINVQDRSQSKKNHKAPNDEASIGKRESSLANSRSKELQISVENASDSEDEGDIFKSVWHNRRPSPGQWIEPIEGFAGGMSSASFLSENNPKREKHGKNVTPHIHEVNPSSPIRKDNEKTLQYENDSHDEASKSIKDYALTDKGKHYAESEDFDVVVEYASDCESCHDNLRSIWRNRRPSPGQWLEPVEAFCHDIR